MTSTEMLYFFRAYVTTILPVIIACVAIFLFSEFEIGLVGFITLTLIINIIPSFLVVLFSDSIGTFAGKLYTGGDIRTPANIHCALIDQARFLKSKGKYNEAIKKIDEFLDQVPGYSEALFLKAQILWEGKKKAGAKQCLYKILKTAENGDQWHRWATTMLRQIK